ncbi:unnamed protein product [Ilex paraguariensis]|uniref:Dirigent protein n=1 Tax=Ilex paraguariensis TaxID=185542 RepID=A0ABC8SY15_9AQUA
MEKLIILLLCSIMLSMPMVEGIAEGPKAVEEWFSKHRHKKEKVTKLHFYFHDTPSGKNPTVLQVAQANGSSTSPTLFGLVFIADDPLTVGPEPNSTLVGRAQGMYSSASLEDIGLAMNLNFVFTAGKFNGSTFSLVGRNQIFHEYREMAIVGGTGVFRLARGIATAKTFTFNTTSGDAVVEYNVMHLMNQTPLEEFALHMSINLVLVNG